MGEVGLSFSFTLWLRTLPARLASHLYLDLNFLWGKTHCFFTPPPPKYVSSLHQYRSSLIDWFWSSFWVFYHAHTILCQEMSNVIRIVSWSRNFVFKVNEWHFFTNRQVGGREKKSACQWHWIGPHTDAVCFGGLLKLVSHIFVFRYIWILSRHLVVVFDFYYSRRL